MNRFAFAALTTIALSVSTASSALALEGRFEDAREGILNKLTERFDDAREGVINQLGDRQKEEREQILNSLGDRQKEAYENNLEIA